MGLGIGALFGASVIILMNNKLGASSAPQIEGKQTQSARANSGPGNRGGRPAAGRRRQYIPSVTMALASESSITKTVEALGEARASKNVAITSQVAGLVTNVLIAPGKRFKKGDLLLQVDNQEQKIGYDRAQAQYPVAKANAERYRQLAEEDAGSRLEAEDAFNALKNIEAELRSAEFTLKQRTISAPFDGIAGLTTVEIGDYIQTGDTITTLDDTSAIVVEFGVPQERAAYISLDQPVEVRLTSDAGVAYTGKVTAIDSRINAQSRTLNVEAIVENFDGRLLPGASFIVTAKTPGLPAIAIPGLALQWDRAGAYVWKRGSDGKALRASVRLVQRSDNIILVEGDVLPGDAIAVDGSDRVRIGVPLPELAEPTLHSKPDFLNSGSALQ